MDWVVECQNLTKRFGDKTVVDNLSLQVARGEVFGVLGPDGAGKTTTFRMVIGLVDPTAGAARVLGFDTRTQTQIVRERIGYVSQRFSLYGDLTIAENVDFFADLYQVPPADRIERSRRLLEASRLTGFEDRLARDLSGGMKQKLALTCALIHTPEVLFLDEPTTGVDPVSRREFWDILYRLVGQGMTLVVSTPFMDEAVRCDRVAFLHQGRLLACGTPDSLAKGGDGDTAKGLEQAFVEMTGSADHASD